MFFFKNKKSLKKELLFIHIPKNAGTSINSLLGQDYPSHIKASEIVEENGQNFLQNFFSFGIVRNPFERFLSLYNYARMEISYYHNNLFPEKSIYGKHLDYDLLKSASIAECAIYLKEGKLKHDEAWNHWNPQITWLYDNENNKCLVDKIYRLENLDELKRDLNRRGFKFKTFPNLNQSKRHNYQDLIDLKSRKILEDYYKDDLEIFNYEF